MAGETGESRINTWVTTAAALAVKRLSKRYGVTQREMLEKLILELDDEVCRSLNSDDQEWDDYFELRSNERINSQHRVC